MNETKKKKKKHTQHKPTHTIQHPSYPSIQTTTTIILFHPTIFIYLINFNGYNNRSMNERKPTESSEPYNLNSLEERFKEALQTRHQLSTLRKLQLDSTVAGGSTNHICNSKGNLQPSVDFSSNDYLGLAHSKAQLSKVNQKYETHIKTAQPPYLGSTGSRLLSGNSTLATNLETKLAKIHSPRNPASALLCNSGYDANLSLLSSIPIDLDYILMDELVHNSLIMGVRMSRIPQEQVITFQHNDIDDLRKKLFFVSKITHEKNSIGHEKKQQKKQSEIIVVIESVYSMDGDVAPLKEILDVALKYDANVIVDEAHGLGVFGITNVQNIINEVSSFTDQTALSNGLDNKIIEGQPKEQSGGGGGCLCALQLESHPALLAAVYTFGKAAGCHGAVIITNEVLKQYLINYARPFIYSTSLPPHSLCTIECAYETMTGREGEKLRHQVFKLVHLFRQQSVEEFKRTFSIEDDEKIHKHLLLTSYSPIQAVMCRGNEHCIRVATMLREKGRFDVFPIRSPTVPKGEERIRIIIHAHNNEAQVIELVQCISKFMVESMKTEAEFERQKLAKL